jgi:hypothetical protein
MRRAANFAHIVIAAGAMMFATSGIAQQTPPAGSVQQTPPTPAPDSTPAAAPPADSKPGDVAAASAAAAQPRPSGESWVTGSLDVGYRWLSGPAGSFETYRSVVDLGEGPKLVGLDLTFLDATKRWFDSAHLRAYDWGHDPYAVFHADAKKSAVYRFNADYRGISYFNNLPSFADPLLARGIMLNEQSFDTHRRLTSISLELRPGTAFTPYFGYERDARAGTGVTVFHTDGNDYPLADTIRDSTNLVRAGVRAAFHHVDVTFEGGGTNFKNDQNTTASGLTYGNSQTPVFGQTLYLTDMLQSYGIRGHSTYVKGVFTASPFSWLDIYGQGMYTMPHSTTNYQQYNAGNFVAINQILFYSGEQYLVSSFASFPHTTANAGWEIRPLRRVRILQGWLMDQMKSSGSAGQNDTLLAGGTTASATAIALTSALALRSSQADTNVMWDAGRGFTVRGGYRYVWGAANDAVTPQEGLITLSHSWLHRHIGSGTVSWRPNQKVMLTGEGELGWSDGTYFRTSLYNYHRVRAMARYQFWKYWQLSGDFRVLNNRNPLAGSSYKYFTHQESATLAWTPRSKKVSVAETYEHCSYHSIVSYLIPQLLAPADSVYREDCHRISGIVNASLPGIRKQTMTVEAGGSAVLTSGSRPTTYYQPVAKVIAPVTKTVAVFGEWRYYGLGELFYQYESFRAHLLTVGLRFTR